MARFLRAYWGCHLYSSTKETHQSLLRAILEIRVEKCKDIYNIFFNNQSFINTLNNIAEIQKSVHAVRQSLDNGSFSKMTSLSRENEHLVLV